MARPNIIYILADDMGFGDMRCNNPDCRIPTPNLDRLAGQGMRFTDAHAASAVCTPSRYSVLTGRYNWRSRLKRGIVWEWDAPLIEDHEWTVASLLKREGYETGCLGKWHLGWNWATKNGEHPNETLEFGAGLHRERHAYADNIDFTKPIGGGPVDRGFDWYFGVDVPNFPPYAWFENDRITAMPSEPKPETMYGNPGPMAPGWELEPMIPEFTRRAVEFIDSRGGAGEGDGDGDARPFFLYFPLTSPHSPIVPNEPFKGMSGIGGYGDFVCEVDWVVGRVMDALERAGLADNTLLIFTSDNGPERQTPDDDGCYQRAERTGHFSTGPLRGIKRDAWEGGHREPFLARWPGVIPPGSTCDQTIGLVDLMATCADVVGAELPDAAAPDSVSILPLLRGDTDQPVRQDLVHHSMNGKFAIRMGDWVYIDAPTGDENKEPDWLRERRRYTAHDQPAELYNLAEDLPERVNRYADEPDIAARLKARLREIQGDDAPPAAHAAAGPITA